MGQYRALTANAETFPYTLPFMFIVASGFWDFLGAGVLGFFSNLLLVTCYEHGTCLTVGHAHAAMFGAFGFLALGMATYIRRISTELSEWVKRRLRWAFWLRNVGLAVIVFVPALPVGFLQLEAAFTETYAAARSLAFYEWTSSNSCSGRASPETRCSSRGRSCSSPTWWRSASRSGRLLARGGARGHRPPSVIAEDDD